MAGQYYNKQQAYILQRCGGIGTAPAQAWVSSLAQGLEPQRASASSKARWTTDGTSVSGARRLAADKKNPPTFAAPLSVLLLSDQAWVSLNAHRHRTRRLHTGQKQTVTRAACRWTAHAAACQSNDREDTFLSARRSRCPCPDISHCRHTMRQLTMTGTGTSKGAGTGLGVCRQAGRQAVRGSTQPSSSPRPPWLVMTTKLGP